MYTLKNTDKLKRLEIDQKYIILKAFRAIPGVIASWALIDLSLIPLSNWRGTFNT
jgi:hypothetical protein